MRRLAADESGFTLIELLVASVLMLVVLGATLTTFESFGSNAETNSRQNDAQDEARRSIDALARELRNLASPTNEQPEAVKRAEPQDLIVQSVATVRPAGSLNTRNTQYVRYCYAAAQRRLYRQRLTWMGATDPPYPTGAGCPASGWGASQIVANDLVNGVRPIFTYNSATLSNVTEIHSNLWVDVNPGRRPRETAIQTTVFLRNQNRVPIARFSAAPTAGGVLLNGSESEDPEERALRYFWYDPAVSTTVPRGEGIVWEYPVPPGPRTVYLVVKDPADLSSQAPSQTVCVPGSGVTC
jgi:prepilin-type N-terminal cleavage/methylation domain-containing protein